MGTIDRLEKFMLSKNINNNQLTVKAGLSVGLIGAARKKRTGLHSENIEKILYAYPELNPTWLLTGKGSMEMNTNYNDIEETLSMVSEDETNYKTLINELRDTISLLKDQLAESKKDRELLRKLIAEKKSWSENKSDT